MRVCVNARAAGQAGAGGVGTRTLFSHGRQSCLHIRRWTAGPSGTAPQGRWGRPANGSVSTAPSCSHGPLTSRELEGGPGVPAASGDRGTLHTRRRADANGGRGHRWQRRLRSPWTWPGVPGALARSTTPGTGGRRRPARGSDRGHGCVSDALRLTTATRPSADYGRWSAPLRGQLGAGSKHLRTKDRRAFLPGSQPQGPRGPCAVAAPGPTDVHESRPGVLGRPHQVDAGGQKQGRAKAAAAEAGPAGTGGQAAAEARRTCPAHRGAGHRAARQPGLPFTRKSVLVWTAKCVSTSQHPRSRRERRRELEAEGEGGSFILLSF